MIFLHSDRIYSNKLTPMPFGFESLSICDRIIKQKQSKRTASVLWCAMRDSPLLRLWLAAVPLASLFHRLASNIGYSTVHRTVSFTPMPFGFESLIINSKNNNRRDLPVYYYLVRHEGLEPPTFAHTKTVFCNSLCGKGSHD